MEVRQNQANLSLSEYRQKQGLCTTTHTHTKPQLTRMTATSSPITLLASPWSSHLWDKIY